MGNMKIAFFGLGNMGLPMASRLAAHGHDVYGKDVAESAVDRFVEGGRNRHRMAQQDIQAADVIITMLPNSAIVESVVLDDGVAQRARVNTLFVDMSSSEPLRSRALGRALRDKGLRYVDAPVSGGVRGAEEGRLAIMTGGDPGDLAELQDLFNVIGRSTIQVGPVGAGHAAKALNNLVSAASVAVTVEALRVAERFGIEGDRFVDVLNASSGRSNTSENKVRQFMLSESFDSGFPIGLMTKDIDIAMHLAGELAVHVELSDAVAALWRKVRDDGHAGEDHTRLYELL